MKIRALLVASMSLAGLFRAPFAYGSTESPKEVDVLINSAQVIRATFDRVAEDNINHEAPVDCDPYWPDTTDCYQLKQDIFVTYGTQIYKSTRVIVSRSDPKYLTIEYSNTRFPRERLDLQIKFHSPTQIRLSTVSGLQKTEVYPFTDVISWQE